MPNICKLYLKVLSHLRLILLRFDVICRPNAQGCIRGGGLGRFKRIQLVVRSKVVFREQNAEEKDSYNFQGIPFISVKLMLNCHEFNPAHELL